MKKHLRSRRPGPLGVLAALPLILNTCLGSAFAAVPAPPFETGQQTCYDTSGNLLSSCVGSGQDGEALAGTAWPLPRFQNNNDGTITDLLTGLQWTQDGNAPGPVACRPSGYQMNWQASLNYVKCLNTNSFLGRSDWRLPNVKELRSLFNASGDVTNQATWLINNNFANVQAGYYKTSTAGVDNNATTPWVVNMLDGSVLTYSLDAASSVWPVRTDASVGGDLLPATGQTLCYNFSNGVTSAASCPNSGQDGEKKAGIAWPSPRFTVPTGATGTVVDNLTGLQWVRDGVTAPLATCQRGIDGSMTWQVGIDFVTCLNSKNYQGHNDWRMPNVNELLTLSNNSQVDPYTWLTTLTQGNFTLAAGTSPYWSSTTRIFTDNSQAWTVLLKQFGSTAFGSKLTNTNYVLPVRTAQTGSTTTYKPGDVNQDGSVDIADALLIYKYLLGQQTLTDAQKALADVAPLDSTYKPAGDSVIDYTDVMTILRKCVGVLSW
ncbi:Lcl domain-containing protein [Geomesophilobacter sediminis]|uniref:DUF1566 domain-containing protein n=1 Tax=Geomesophilobacter sediminis TaxID=2798584 RepID=A0A8J7LUK2_9BACT|nr:DUF1566 domain-containing protein [Geomesophilobacter sediminis]MBJ6724754.1 DUF1566 domain-containing protein [Geomesophilobacter sediminis]